MSFQPDGFYYATKTMENKWGRGRWDEQSHPSCYGLKAEGHIAGWRGGRGGALGAWLDSVFVSV